MKTIEMANEPKTKKPRSLEVNLNNCSGSVQVTLLDTDGTPILKGAPEGINLGPVFGVNQEENDKVKKAREAAVDKIEDAIAEYYQAIN
jgi:hypothetical protein